MGNEIQKVRYAVESQLKQTDEIIASNEVIADAISEVSSALEYGFSELADGLQELCFSIDNGLREVCDRLDLQRKTLEAIREILEKPLDTQAKELRKRAEEAYLNKWYDEAETDLLEAEKKNYQDFIVHHILGNIYFYHKKNYQKALEYYQKAAKYATPRSKQHAVNALICAGMVYYNLDQLSEAYNTTKTALELLPQNSQEPHTKILYKCQTCGYTSPAIPSIPVRCFACKTYDSYIKVEAEGGQVTKLTSRILYHHARYAAKMGYMDEFIDCLRKSILKDPDYLIAADRDEIFSDMKVEVKKLSEDLRDKEYRTVNNLLQEINSARKEAETLRINNFTSLDNKLDEINKLYKRNSYLDLLNAEQLAQKAYEESIEEWIKVKEALLDELKSKEGKIKNGLAPAPAGWGFILAIIAGILAVVVINSKYIYDSSKMISNVAVAFWVIGFPIIVWIVSAIVIEQTKLSTEWHKYTNIYNA